MDSKNDAFATYFSTYYNRPDVHLEIPGLKKSQAKFIQVKEEEYVCDSTIVLDPIDTKKAILRKKRDETGKKSKRKIAMTL